MTILAISFSFVVGLSIGLVLFWLLRYSLEKSIYREYAARFEEWIKSEEESIREDSLRRSRSSIKARITEQIVPILPNFAYNASDMRFLGDPIDYVVFDGYTEAKDAGVPDIREIVFVEVKQGKASLTKEQRLIKEAVEAHRVRWEVVRPDDNGIIEYSEV